MKTTTEWNTEDERYLNRLLWIGALWAMLALAAASAAAFDDFTERGALAEAPAVVADVSR